MPGSGYTARTEPSGATGDSTTATPTASRDPATTAPSTPGSPSLTVAVGPAPRARSVSRSPASARNCRPATWPAMISAASPAIPPNTASAIDAGSMARCALASVSDVT